MPCRRVSKCPKDVAQDKGGYFCTRAGVNRGIEIKSEAKASMKVDREGDPNARCQYATNRAQGSSWRVKRITEHGGGLMVWALGETTGRSQRSSNLEGRGLWIWESRRIGRKY